MSSITSVFFYVHQNNYKTIVVIRQKLHLLVVQVTGNLDHPVCQQTKY